jgi:hypothetical protein
MGGRLRSVPGALRSIFLEDAEYCPALGLLHRGRLVARGSPAALKRGLALDLLGAA